MKLPLRFMREQDAVLEFDGVPVSENALDMEIGDCSRCHEPAAPKGHGILTNPRIENGSLIGDVICIDCALADPDFEFDLDEAEEAWGDDLNQK